MNYTETISYLFSQLPMYQRIGPSAYKNDLNTTLLLDKITAYPHKNFKSIHIAGTNGKGSVSHMLAAVLQEAGYKTGLYTSPHILDFRERIRINGLKIPRKNVVEFVKRHKKDFDIINPSFFEMTVALAFRYFSDEKVDIAIIETGMGGRLDSTNIVSPEISVITNIGFDHTQFLGKTFEKIAIEKSGIIKEGIPLIVGEYNNITKEVFLNQASKKNSTVFFASDNFSSSQKKSEIISSGSYDIYKKNSLLFNKLNCDLKGLYQKKNIITAIQVLDQLNKNGLIVSTTNIYKGFNNIVSLTGIRGRWEIIGTQPLEICDIAHNQDGLRIVVDQLNMYKSKNVHMIIGFVNDKELGPILELFPQNAKYYFTKASIPRSLDEKELLNISLDFGLKGKHFPNIETAYKSAKSVSEKDDIIYIGGSTFVVAELLSFISKY